MSISFSGLASGLDTSSWVEALVSVKQQKVTALQSELTALKNKKTTVNDTRSIISSLRTSLEKLTDVKFGGGYDLFGKNTATSSNEEIFTATAASGAVRQNYDIVVNQLATCTKAESIESASATADLETKLSDLGVTEGAFTLYVDGVKKTVEIEEGDTLETLRTKLDAKGVYLEVVDSYLQLSSRRQGNTFANYYYPTLDIGSTTDTSNFASILGLTKSTENTTFGNRDKYTSKTLYKANVGSKLTDANAGFKTQITAGTFTIGDATFTIDENTTLSSIISQINSSDKAQAYASWDSTTGKLSITSKKEGASYINIQAGTSNFTHVMGLTERIPTRPTPGTRLLTAAQELGKNALFTINGASMTSTSNTVSSDITRIDGVTLTLNKVSSAEDGVTTLKVSQDTSGLTDAVKSFISAYNDAISKIDEVTASGADLQRESSLTSLKRTLGSYANGVNSNGGIYKLLSEIGISTAQADGTNLSTDTNKLEFDEGKFLKALEENPDSVKSILTGDTGVLSMMENTVEQALTASNGYFDIKTSSIDSDIKRMEEKITKQQTSIINYRAQLERKFSNMELMISKMQQNYSNFLS